MAHTAFEAATPSMRGVRDKYLDLLLTGGSSVTPTAPTAPSPAIWTPGQHFSPHTAAHWAARPPPQPPAWSTPVTPGPTEGDVRLAEIAAGLVAAGGVEHRQSDTIRRLATQLERSERKLRSLESKKRRARSAMREEDFNPPSKGVPKNDARRHIRFTPGKEERDGRRRVANQSQRRPTREVYEELERLRREREEWMMGKKRSEAEARSLSTMLADIKNNTSRLLDERNDHLKVIAQLQEEVSELKRRPPIRVPSEVPPVHIHSRNTGSPVPFFRRRESLDNIPNIYEDAIEISPSVRDLSSVKAGDGARAPDSAGAREVERLAAEHDASLRRSSQREQELREELQLVLEENAKLSERIPELEALCVELSTQVQNTEAESQDKDPVNATQCNSASTCSIANELEQLVEELEILEGVSDAINFGMTPSEVDRAQETMSNLDLTVDDADNQKESAKETTTQSPGEVIQNVVMRLVQIRARLSFRYGQWLKAVGNDDLTSLATEDNPDAGLRGNGPQGVDETMNSQIIDRIIGLE